MGLVKLPNERDYWSENLIFHNLFIPTIMSRDKYYLMSAALHLEEDEKTEGHKENMQKEEEDKKESEKEDENALKKISNLLNTFNDLSQKAGGLVEMFLNFYNFCFYKNKAIFYTLPKFKLFLKSIKVFYHK